MERNETSIKLASSYLEAAARQGRYSSNPMGIDENLTEALNSLSLAEYYELVDKASSFINVELDEGSLLEEIEGIRNNRGRRNMEDHFIFHQASSKMMSQLFGMNTQEFSRRRKSLGMTGNDQHRPRAVDIETEAHIWESWKANADMDDRDRYLAVSEDTGQPLRQVWTVVKRLEVH